ncbi:MAG: SDR family NAD(P)-dependent oxidoreductase [bacterium]|nr:SDR family NAD(P)-dependent oxidoreductase [bacterium]
MDKSRDVAARRKEILQQVAEHRITPEEGFKQVKELHRQTVPAPPKIEKIYFHNVWKPAAAAAENIDPGELKNVLIFDTDRQIAHQLAKYLEREKNDESGIQVVMPGKKYTNSGSGVFTIDPGNPDDYKLLVDDLEQGSMLPADIVHLWSRKEFIPYENRIREQLTMGLYSVFFLSRALLEQGITKRTRFFYFFSNDTNKFQPLYGAVSGFAKTINRENPRFIARTIEVTKTEKTEFGAVVFTELKSRNTGSVEIQYDGELRYVKRLRETGIYCEIKRVPVIKENGVYIITGGVGGLGLIFAEYIAKQAAVTLVLVGRSELDFKKEVKLTVLESFGAEVVYLKADISRPEDAAYVITETKARFKEIQGIIHCAGVTRDAFVLKKTAGEISDVLAPKVYGTIYLDEAAHGEDLDFFVLFSSLSGVLGNPGQSDYAFANMFMDIYAGYRDSLQQESKRSGKTLSIDWPLWEKGGMLVSEPTQDWMREKLGMIPLAEEDGIQAFEEGLMIDRSQLIIIEGVKEKILDFLYVPETIAQKSSPLKQDKTVLQERTEEFLKEILSEETKIGIHKIKSAEGFEKYGIDSVLIISLINRLEKDFGELSKTLFFEYRNIYELAKYFIENHRTTVMALSGVHTVFVPETHKQDFKQDFKEGDKRDYKEEDIAIIGLSGRYPGAKNVDEFWENLTKGKDSIIEIPAARWEESAPDGMFCKWGGFIDDIDVFDPLFFNISPREAEKMDPQERLFLEIAWETIEDAAYTRAALSNNCVGVFVGVMYSEYQLYGGSSSYASIANRVSYFFNFNGPSLSLDTMCSSSLTAIHLACRSIQSGECDLALAGGVNLSMHPSKYLFLNEGTFLSSDGRCRSFGEGGDGYVPGEGVGAVLLKPLQTAEKDGDHIYGLIKASGINHGGTTNGYTVPNPNEQANLITGVLRRANINPGTISYIEAHGTGTVLGDPIEIRALSKAFFRYTRERNFCSIGSVKSNIGHLESAAGIASLTKVLLQMKNKKLVPSLHSEIPNPNIDFKESPFYVQHSLVPWEQPRDSIGTASETIYPRRAGISAFGAGGANAHILIEEYENKFEDKHIEKAGEKDQSFVIVLSAKNNERLPAYANKILLFLEQLLRQNADILKKIVSDITSAAAECITVPEHEIDYYDDIREYGFDPLTIRLLIDRVNKKYNIDMPASVFSTHPALYSLAQYVYDSFKETIYSYYGFDEESPGHFSITNFAYTLQLGREAFEERLAIAASNVHEIIEGLRLYCSGEELPLNVYTGSSRRGESRGYIENKELHSLIRKWVSGENAAWDVFYKDKTPKKMSLPVYPFAGKRYWVSGVRSPVLTSGKKLHPLLDRNESTVTQEKFLLRLTGDEFFLKDHIIGNEPVVPGVVHIEMALAAAELAAEREISSVRKIVWLQPLAVTGSGCEILICLQPHGDGIDYEIVNRDTKRRIVYSQGTVDYAASAAPGGDTIDIEAIKKRCPAAANGDSVYDLFRQRGLHYGVNFRTIRELHYSDTESLALLQLPEKPVDFSRYKMYPSLFDGVLQSIAGFLSASDIEQGTLFLPFELGAIHIIQDLTESCYAYCVPGEGAGPSSDTKRFDIRVTDETGRLLAEILGFSVREKHRSSRDVIYYREVWKDSFKDPAIVPAGGDEFPGYILLFDTNKNLYQRLAELLPGTGLVLVKPGKEYQALGNNTAVLNPAVESHYHDLFESLINQHSFPAAIIHNWSKESFSINNTNEKKISHHLARGFYSVFYICRELLKYKPPHQLKILHLYYSALNSSEPLSAAVAGFMKTAAMEYQKFFLKSVHIESGINKTTLAEILLTELEQEDRDTVEIRYTANGRQIKIPEEIAVPAGSQAPAVFKEKGVYVITGGTGGLGLIFAEYIAKTVPAVLVLLGRSHPGPEQQKKIRELETAGSEVLFLPGDISQGEITKKIIAEVKSRYGAINGIIHSAGITRDSLLVHKTPEEIESVLGAKVFGTINIDEALKDEPLDFFILFSSVSAVTGNPGQSDYAFGNDFMDNFAEYRAELVRNKERSGKTAAINWPLWEEGGMSVHAETRDVLKKALGIVPLSTGTGCRAFLHAVSLAGNQLIVLEGDGQSIRRKLPGGEKQNKPEAAAVHGVKEIRSLLQEDLVTLVCAILKLEREDVDINEEMSHYGFDSVSLTEFANSVNEKCNLDVTPALFFEYSSIDRLTVYLLEQYTEILQQRYPVYSPGEYSEIPEWEEPTVPEIPSRFFPPEETAENSPVAVIGISGVLPQSDDLEIFRENLEAGKNLVTEIPSDRWDWREFYGNPLYDPNTTNSRWGGFLTAVDAFDASFFGISPREAELMDPQHRIFLEVIWKTIEDAGYCPADLAGTGTGLFAGVAAMDYLELLQTHTSGIEAYTSTGNAHSMLVNRVSYLLDFHGPSEPVNTACSSSLVAIHRAVGVIQSGECEYALAGGVNVILSPAPYISFSKAGMLSSDGACKTFDKDANGYVRGEGAGAVLLKSLARAKQDGDYIYAVIKGSAINHGGYANSLTAPNPNAQAELIIRAYENARIDPATVRYIEAHGTGTVLGDPVEINGLKKAFSVLFKKRASTSIPNASCGIGSVKTNVGHLETAAGIAGILKIILSMKYKKLYAQIHMKEINPYISLEDSPFYIQNETTPWHQVTDAHGVPVPRRAGISSFGFGGVNAHVILEEYPRRERVKKDSGVCRLFVLSARDADALTRYAENLVRFINKMKERVEPEEPPLDLVDLAYTLQLGRSPMEERLSLVASNYDELLAKLDAFLQNNAHGSLFFRGNNRNNEFKQGHIIDGIEGEEFITILINNSNFEKLARLWVNGITIPWELLYPSEKPNRVPLPTYPFAKERYWLPLAPANTETAGSDTLKDLIKIISGKLKIDHKNLSGNSRLDETGITSILFIELLQEINNHFGVDLLLTGIAGITTIKELADYIAAGEDPEEPLLVPAEKTGTGSSFINNYKQAFLNYNTMDIFFIKTASEVPIEFFTCGTGEPVLLLLPIDCNAAAWKNQVNELSNNFKIMIPHYPGYGRSPFNNALSSFEIFAENIMGICDILNKNRPVHVVGWSLGGFIAQIMASNYPEKIKSLTLVNTTAKLEASNSIESVHKIIGLLKEDFCSHKSEAEEDLFSIIKATYNVNIILHYFSLVLQSNLRDLLPRITAPALIISGACDKLTTPENSEFLHDSIQHSEYYKLEGAGHYIPLHNYQYFNEKLTEFIRSH